MNQQQAEPDVGLLLAEVAELRVLVAGQQLRLNYLRRDVMTRDRVIEDLKEQVAAKAPDGGE